MKKKLLNKSLAIPALCALLMIGLTVAWRAAAGNSRLPVPTLEELLQMSSDELARQDLAVINLACSEDLNGTSEVNKEACLAQLDEWADEISEILTARKNLYSSYRMQTGQSLNQWRCAVIASYLHNVAGVRYTSALKGFKSRGYDDTRFFKNAKDVFLAGILTERNRASCASMPVMFAAIGRRLGYPIELVTTRNHLFARWSHPKETFNIECTDRYAQFKPDDFYRQFPVRLNPGEEVRKGYLINLTPERTLAAFLHLRGQCLRENRRYSEAKEAFLASIRLNPEYFDPPYRNIFIEMIERDIMIAESERMRLPCNSQN